MRARMGEILTTPKSETNDMEKHTFAWAMFSSQLKCVHTMWRLVCRPRCLPSTSSKYLYIRWLYFSFSYLHTHSQSQFLCKASWMPLCMAGRGKTFCMSWLPLKKVPSHFQKWTVVQILRIALSWWRMSCVYSAKMLLLTPQWSFSHVLGEHSASFMQYQLVNFIHFAGIISPPQIWSHPYLLSSTH